MMWLGAVITDAELEADAVSTETLCIPDCTICLDACPAQALDGITIVQSKCRSVSARYSEGGGGVYACNTCRKVCPNSEGVLAVK